MSDVHLERWCRCGHQFVDHYQALWMHCLLCPCGTYREVFVAETKVSRRENKS